MGIGLVLNFSGCASYTTGKEARSESDMSVSRPSDPQTALVHDILTRAFSQVGNLYRYGGTKPETGFDCSGFVSWVYEPYQIKLPRISRDMFSVGKHVDRKDLRPGDLVFFGRRKRITHVGIYTGDNLYIHSPSRGKKLRESSLDDRSRGEYYAGARRIINNEGVVTPDKSLKQAWQHSETKPEVK